MAIGGAEDKFRERTILSTFLGLSGGRNADVVIVPTASSIEDAGERYKAIFIEMGARSAHIAHVSDRDQANDPASVEPYATATGIFMTGGNQLRLSTTIGGSLVESAIKDRWQAGATVAGTSAGASILSSHMVAFGTSGPTPRQRMATIVAGFGLIDFCIIDQHFRQRDRTGRLLSLIAIVTAFTVAHSITLALSVLGLVTLPSQIVEPVIALSIAYVAFENLTTKSMVSRRWAVSFLFGLVHGFGFAGALAEVGLPASGLAAALVGFNIGVEAGQALIVSLLLPLLIWLQRFPWEPRLIKISSTAIMAVGLALLTERALIGYM